MSTEQNRRIAERFHACDADDYAELMSPDFKGHDAMGHTWDREFGVAGLRSDLEAFSGLHDDVHDLIVEGDKVAVGFTRSGLFTAKFESFEPTHKHVKFDVMEILHIRDGQIREGWFYNDDGTVARALKGET
jgi:predicted ester cyclase